MAGQSGRGRGAIVERPWIDDMKISTTSWGYIKGQEYKSANVIIDGLIDRVSRGGGLLLSLCPKADGTISSEQKDVLLSMGKWLETNGEAIYGTRPWKIHAEGPQERLNIGRGNRRKWVFDDCDARDIRFTRKGNTLYAIVLGWPEMGRLTVKTLGDNTRVATGGIKKVSLLGSKRELKWSRSGEGLLVKLPNRKQDEYAYALKIEVGGDLVMD